MTELEFQAWPKTPRLSNERMTITEKLDGTNAQIFITPEGEVHVGSRTRWITPGKNTDNFGFAQWVQDNKEALLTLGHGRHYGEWYGLGIQRGYGLTEKRFALFNTQRPSETLPDCVSQVPVLYVGPYSTEVICRVASTLRERGSVAVPGFMNPEGVVVYSTLTRSRHKVIFEGDSDA